MITENGNNMEQKKIKCELFNDNFQNYKKYGIPKAQLVIADIPYNLGNNAYASSPEWYEGGDNKNGESNKAGKSFFHTDNNFNIAEYFHFCNRLLKKEPKGRNEAPAMIVFCSFEQAETVKRYGEKHGFFHNFPIYFIKNYSGQVLKANMKIVGATEIAIVLYRDKLPKFRNDGKMIFNWFYWEKDGREIPKLHPTQKPVSLLRKLIRIFTDEGDIVIDPCAGSGTTLRAARDIGRNSYGFECYKPFYEKAKSEMLTTSDNQLKFW